MANFNTLIKRKQYLWLGLILVGGAAAVGGGLYLSELNLNSDEEAPAQGEPASHSRKPDCIPRQSRRFTFPCRCWRATA